MFGLTVANDRVLYKVGLTCLTEHVHDDIVAKRNFNFTKSLYGRFNTIGYTGSLEKVIKLEKKKKNVKHDTNTVQNRVMYVDKSEECLNKQKEELEKKIENIIKLKQLKRERQRIRKYKHYLYLNAKIIQRAWVRSRIVMKQNAVAVIISMIKKQQYKRAISVGATAVSIIKRFVLYASLRYIAYKEGESRKHTGQMISNQLSTNLINVDIIPTVVSHVVSVSVAKHKKSNKTVVSGDKNKSVNDKRRQSVNHQTTPKGKNVKNVSGKSFDGNASAFITEGNIDLSIINATHNGKIANYNSASSSKIITPRINAEISSEVTSRVNVPYNTNLRINIPTFIYNNPADQNCVDAKLEKSLVESSSNSTPALDVISKSTKVIENTSNSTTAQKYSDGKDGNANVKNESRSLDNKSLKVNKILSKIMSHNPIPIGVLPPLKPKVPSLSELHIVKSKDELQKAFDRREKEYEVRVKELERELLRRQLYKDENLMKERELRIKVVESRKLEKDRVDREKELELAEIQLRKDEKKKQYISNIIALQLERAKTVIEKQKQLNNIRKRKLDEDNRIKQELLSMRKEDALLLSKYELKRMKVHSFTPILPLHASKNNDDSVDTNDIDENDDDDDLTPEELEKLKLVREAKFQKEAADKARMVTLEVARKERLRHKFEDDKRIKLEAEELLKKREYVRQQLMLQQQEVLMNNINSKKKHEEYLKKQGEKHKQKQEMKLKGATLPDEMLKKAEIDPDDYIVGEDEGDDPFVFNKFITDEFKFSEFLDSAESINIEPIADKSNKKSKIPPDERRKPKVAIPAILKNTPYYNDYKLVVKNLPLHVKSSTKKIKFVDDSSTVIADVNDEDSVNSAGHSSVSSLNSMNSSNRIIATNSKANKNTGTSKSTTIDSVPVKERLRSNVSSSISSFVSAYHNATSANTNRALLYNKSMNNDPIIPFAQFIKAGPSKTALSHIVPKNSIVVIGNENIKTKVDELYKSNQQEALQISMQFLVARNTAKVSSLDDIISKSNNGPTPASDLSHEIEIDNVGIDDVDDDSSVNTNCVDEKYNLYDNGNYQRFIDVDYEKALDEECEYLTNLLKNKIENKLN